MSQAHAQPFDPAEPSVAEPGPVATQRASRRTILASGLGALVGVVGSALGRPTPARAANGDFMVLGAANASTATTKITVPTDALSGLWTVASGATATGLRATASGSGGAAVLGEATGQQGIGIFGSSATGSAVYGSSTSGCGVQASSESWYGVLGVTYVSDRAGVYGSGANGGIGVEGHSLGGVAVSGVSDSSIGVSGVSTSWFGLSGSSDSSYGVYGETKGTGAAAIAVHGTATNGIGMLGKSRATDQPGVIGWSGNDSTGIQGFSNPNNANPPAARAKTGVFGQATQDSTSRGVLGVAAAGDGVRGEATSGAAVRGTANSKAGYAFRGSGRLRFEKVSGVATIAANATSVKVTPGTDVTTGSFVLLTAQSNIGARSLYYTVDPTGNTITIHLSSSRTSSTVVAWLLLN